MSAICGILPLATQRRHDLMCRDMLADQARFGPHAQAMHSTADISLSRALHLLLPEDIHDVQPAAGGSGRFLFVADLRIDNRVEVLAMLGGRNQDALTLSDVAILVAAFERWQEEAFSRLVGAFAVAVWDCANKRLILARDATGQRPLHYYADDRFFAFASTPSGLVALPEVPSLPDEERLVKYIAGLASEAPRTFYKDVRQVESGHVMIVTRDGSISSSRYWNPTPRTLRLNSMEDYVHAYREQLDQAVQSQLRGCEDLVATHLSAGLDSSAVTTTAARLLAAGGGRVLAFTAAPRLGYDGAVPRGRIADESLIAAETASRYPNVEHVVLRPTGESLFEILKSDTAMAQEPIPLLCNSSWWRAINGAAQARGARALLLGEAGNVTITAGGIHQLSAILKERGLSSWLAEARALVAGGTVTWPGVLASTFGAHMPRALWNTLNVVFLGTSPRLAENFLIGSYWREQFARHNAEIARETRLPRDIRDYRLKMMQRISPGNLRKEALATSGIDVRDPTADRRVVEFCLSLPSDVLLSRGVSRALARTALADRVPATVLNARLRGLQCADWHEHINAAAASRALEEVQDCEAVRRVVDVDRMRKLIADWPTAGWERYSVIGDYRDAFLKTLAAAYFIQRATGRKVAPRKPADILVRATPLQAI